jgi:hypothetical protein
MSDSPIKRYKKKPVEIQAVQLTPENGPIVWEWADSKPLLRAGRHPLWPEHLHA